MLNKSLAENVVNVMYAQNKTSVNTNELGMREMQQRVYEERRAQYLLVKAPPASGKSRALMFVGLDKLFNQGISKIIVAVPEQSIGASFASTNLTDNGFFADWVLDPKNNLCTAGSTSSKVQHFLDFLESKDPILVCTHATLRFAEEKCDPSYFDNTCIAIDEFHHVSADTESNRLGALIKRIMDGSDAHIVAMTGSYFRGDSVPVLSPETEAKFVPVTYNYYDQLNGYQYLKSLGIGHHFYQGQYTDAIGEVLDLDKKTIVHIPSVNSGESTKDKYEEVGRILDVIGEVLQQEPETGILLVKRKDNGQVLRVADLVDDQDLKLRARILDYLATNAQKNRDAVDIVLALGMAKEGFDWPFAEHALTIGYRASLTEVIQIIGRVTRDCEGKEHAQFTNLISEPDASQGEVSVAVNNMLKAITASLLMEQVLAPNMEFRSKVPGEVNDIPGTVKIEGFKEPSTDRSRQIIETDLSDLKAAILQDDRLVRAAAGDTPPELVNKALIPKIIRERYPDLTDNEVEEVRQHVVADSVITNSETKEVGDKKFLLMGSRFVNIDSIDINLIDSINPFQKAFEVMSKSVTPNVLRLIGDTIKASKITMEPKEAMQFWVQIQAWVKTHNGKKPDFKSGDPQEKMLGEALIVLQRAKRERQARQQAAGEGE